MKLTDAIGMVAVILTLIIWALIMRRTERPR